MTDNNNNNRFDSIFSETTPAQLRSSIFQQAEIILAQNRRREALKKFAFIFGGLATASVVGINISRNFFKKQSGDDMQVAEWTQLLTSEDSLSVAELSDEEMEMIQQLDQFDDLSEDEFEFILKEEV